MLPSSDKRQLKFQMVPTLGSTSTWQDLAEHWLRFQSAENFETREQVKRQAAVQRWRGVEDFQQQQG